MRSHEEEKSKEKTKERKKGMQEHGECESLSGSSARLFPSVFLLLLNVAHLDDVVVGKKHTLGLADGDGRIGRLAAVRNLLSAQGRTGGTKKKKKKKKENVMSEDVSRRRCQEKKKKKV